MLVKTFGVTYETQSKVLTLADLFDRMAATSGRSDKSKGLERIFYVDRTINKNFALGLVVTVKDQTRYCRFARGASPKIEVSPEDELREILEFNFFCINVKNGLGVYQYHNGSCSPALFGSYLRSMFRAMLQESLEQKLEALEKSGESTPKKIKQIRSAHHKGLIDGILTHKDSLPEILKKYKAIRAMSFTYQEVSPDFRNGVAIGPYAKLLHQRVTFGQTAPLGALAAAIANFVKEEALDRGRIEVIDSVDDIDVPMSVRIASIPQNFGEADYDGVAGSVNGLQLDQFASHRLCLHLLELCTKDHKAIFMSTLK